MNHLSLGRRVALITIVTSVVTVAALLATAYTQLVRDFEDVLTQRQVLEAEASALRVNQELQLRLQALNAFGTALSTGRALLSTDRIEALLARQDLLQNYFPEGLVVHNQRHVAIAESRFAPGRLGTSYADRPHFQAAARTRQPVISRPIIGRATGIPLLSFLAPVESDEGDLLGSVSGILSLAETSAVLRQSARREGEIFSILDTDQLTRIDVLSADNPIPDLPPPGADPIIDAALSGVTTGVVTDNSGQDWIFATRHLDRVGWLFVQAVPYEQAAKPAWQSFQSVLWVSLSVLLGLVAIALALVRSATRPLEAMSEQIHAMSDNPAHTTRLEPTGPPEVRKVAVAFNQLMQEREALDELKSQFVATVSHELRTPLTSIYGSLKLLDRGTAGTLPEKAAPLVAVALRNAGQLQRLIADILDFNKMAAGQLEVRPEPLNLKQAVAEACEGNQSMARHYRVRLSAEIAPELTVYADAVRLRQVLDNLISNAIKFSPESGAVDIHASSMEPNRVRMTVSDQGTGVPEHFLPRLFQRFAQAESGSTRARAGSGLGLAITRELVMLMAGNIGYEYHNGARFWLELPAAPDHTSTPGASDDTTRPAG